jgi:yecA family protein
MTTRPGSESSSALTPDEESWLRAFLLRSRERTPDVFCLEEIYGFLHAIVSAPELVPSADWVGAIFGDDGAQFETQAEAEKFYQLMMDLYNRFNQGVLQQSVHLPASIERRRPALLNFEPDSPLHLWSRGFAQGHDWLEEAWEIELPEEIDEPLGSCVAALMFFVDRGFGESLLEEIREARSDAGAAPADLAELANSVLEGFETFMLGYAQIGRLLYSARLESDDVDDDGEPTDDAEEN